MSPRFVSALGFLASAVLWSSASPAEPVTYAFTGTAFYTWGFFAGEVTSVTGTYSVDPDLLTVDTFPGADRDYWSALDNPAAGWNITVTVGSVTIESASNQNQLGAPHHILQAIDLPDVDQWSFDALRVDLSDTAIRLIARDEVGSPPDGLRVGSNNLNVDPILEPGDLESYDAPNYSEATVFSEEGFSRGSVFFDLESIAPVPEPSSGLLIGVGFLALHARRRR